MRIISGEARGRRLLSLKGDESRPTLDRVKESIFNIIQFELEGKKVLDLFAGSGQLGIEAVSRGAKAALLVDNNRAACETIRKNVRISGLEDRITVACTNYKSIHNYKSSFPAFDVVFLDPPYYKGFIEKSLVFLKDNGFLSADCVIITESALDEELPARVDNLINKKSYNYGAVKLNIYRSE